MTSNDKDWAKAARLAAEQTPDYFIEALRARPMTPTLDDLGALIYTLENENERLRARIAELEAENEKLRQSNRALLQDRG